MSTTNSEVQVFFTEYETANAVFDVAQIAACYADGFMFGGPEGVQCVKNEDFLKVLPRRKEFFKSQGLVSSKIDSLEGSTLDSKYTLVKVIWDMTFDRGSGELVHSQNAASYILSRTKIAWKLSSRSITRICGRQCRNWAESECLRIDVKRRQSGTSAADVQSTIS